jgi:phosphoglycolate phosphatase-like HAD superfamily hydrolase
MDLLLFDIDGTLILSGGAGARALERAFFALHAVRDGMQGIRFAGRTDPAIVLDVFQERLNRDPAPHEVDALFAAYIPLLEEEVARSERYAVMPGVADLLGLLQNRRDVAVGLVTGNIEPAARIKLARAGLDRHFRFGGYGSDAHDRTELTRLAIARGRAIAGNSGGRVLVIGDTIADVRAGREAGALTIAVATGGTPRETLAAESPDLLLNDLSDPVPLLSILDPA